MPRQRWCRWRWCLPVVLGLWVLGVPAIFRGDVTEVERYPDPPILVGTFVDYWVIADDPTGWFSMEWHCVGQDPGHGTWSYPPWYEEWNPFQFEYSCVGTYDLRFGAEEQLEPEDPPFWSYKTEQDTVLGPDTDEVASGLNVDTSDEVEIRFDVLRGTTPIGGSINGYAQETVKMVNPANGNTYESGWVGPNVGAFWWDESDAQIIDIKELDTSHPAFQALAIGGVAWDVYQRNRLVIKDCSGADQLFVFAEHHFQQVKSGADTWKLVEVQP